MKFLVLNALKKPICSSECLSCFINENHQVTGSHGWCLTRTFWEVWNDAFIIFFLNFSSNSDIGGLSLASEKQGSYVGVSTSASLLHNKTRHTQVLKIGTNITCNNSGMLAGKCTNYFLVGFNYVLWYLVSFQMKVFSFVV